MNKQLDKGYAFDGVEYQFRPYEDPTGQEKPIWIFEPREGHEKAFSEKRLELAEHLTKQVGTTPDKVTWLEQSADSSIRAYDIAASFQTVSRPYANDMTQAEMVEGERSGKFSPEVGMYTPSTELRHSEVKALETKVGESIEPYETRQNREFAEWTASTKKNDHAREYTQEKVQEWKQELTHEPQPEL